VAEALFARMQAANEGLLARLVFASLLLFAPVCLALLVESTETDAAALACLVLTLLALLVVWCSLYLLYSLKRMNTDAAVQDAANYLQKKRRHQETLAGAHICVPHTT
jgi:hypothetical protein